MWENGFSVQCTVLLDLVFSSLGIKCYLTPTPYNGFIGRLSGGEWGNNCNHLASIFCPGFESHSKNEVCFVSTLLPSDPGTQTSLQSMQLLPSSTCVPVYWPGLGSSPKPWKVVSLISLSSLFPCAHDPFPLLLPTLCLCPLFPWQSNVL